MSSRSRIVENMCNERHTHKKMFLKDSLEILLRISRKIMKKYFREWYIEFPEQFF